MGRYVAIKDGQMTALGKYQWSVARLITLAAGLEVMDIPLKHLNVYNAYKNLTLREMVSHIKATHAADLTYPIILDEDGEIMDGRHRIMKALLTDAPSIKAVRFDSNPAPCLVDSGPA